MSATLNASHCIYVWDKHNLSSNSGVLVVTSNFEFNFFVQSTKILLFTVLFLRQFFYVSFVFMNRRDWSNTIAEVIEDR